MANNELPREVLLASIDFILDLAALEFRPETDALLELPIFATMIRRENKIEGFLCPTSITFLYWATQGVSQLRDLQKCMNARCGSHANPVFLFRVVTIVSPSPKGTSHPV